MRKNILLVIASLLFLVQTKSVAQNNCWQQGDMVTRIQITWDATTTWYSDYDAVYLAAIGRVEVGIPGPSGYSRRFTGPDKVSDFLPEIGTPQALIVDQIDGTANGNQFAGEVLALTLNIDFSDAGYLSGNSTIPFGDLILYDLGNLNLFPIPELDGKSVREVIAIANFILGGGSSTFDISAINHIVAVLNGAFLDGTPSQFAQLHLRKGWQQGDMFTRTQAAWDAGGTVDPDFTAAYGSRLGAVSGR